MELPPAAGGQQPSPGRNAVIGRDTHLAAQVPALIRRSSVQGLESAHDVGQRASSSGGALTSHSSPLENSKNVLPHNDEQSASSCEVQPDGQHSSVGPQAVISLITQRAVQSPASPTSSASRQPGFFCTGAIGGGAQLFGHDALGSQVSPRSRMPLPHTAGQSVSCVWLLPGRQQPSPETGVVIWGFWHAYWQPMFEK